MFKIKRIYVLFVLIVLASCWTDPTYKGFTETDSGLYYKLQMIGDGKRKPTIGDYLQLNITYKTVTDSVFMDTRSGNDLGMVFLPFNHSSFEGSFEEGLSIMNEGDSVTFIVGADNLFTKFFKSQLPLFLKKDAVVLMDVKLHRILNKKEYEDELVRYETIIEDRDIEEQRKIQLFLDTSKVSFSRLQNGIFYLPVTQGSGSFPERGNTLRINYTGCFLNGKIFESTYDRGQPLEYICGEQGQVIKGLESAISLMNEGAKAKFIIPSHLAYGEDGSSTGIIPPYTTVIYEIELLNLTKKQ